MQILYTKYHVIQNNRTHNNVSVSCLWILELCNLYVHIDYYYLINSKHIRRSQRLTPNTFKHWKQNHKQRRHTYSSTDRTRQSKTRPTLPNLHEDPVFPHTRHSSVQQQSFSQHTSHTRTARHLSTTWFLLTIAKIRANPIEIPLLSWKQINKANWEQYRQELEA